MDYLHVLSKIHSRTGMRIIESDISCDSHIPCSTVYKIFNATEKNIAILGRMEHRVDELLAAQFSGDAVKWTVSSSRQVPIATTALRTAQPSKELALTLMLGEVVHPTDLRELLIVIAETFTGRLELELWDSWKENSDCSSVIQPLLNAR